MTMSYNRQSSPGARRLVNPARASDSTVDAYNTRYVSPRSSGERVIPISTQTFLNPPRDPYSGRNRRSSLVDRSRRPVLHEIERSSSPPRTREYYVVPSTPEKKSHKKVYSIGEDGAKLVEQHRHRRRDSYDKKYPATRKSIDDEDAYSYTDAAGMFRDTQPSWRERPRETSLDRAREDPRSSRRDGPPVSQRGWDKIQDLGRTRSVRNQPVERRQSVERRADSDLEDGYRRSPRRSSVTRRDRSVSRRGFGIRPDSPGSPQRAPRAESPQYEERARRESRLDHHRPVEARPHREEPREDRHRPAEARTQHNGSRDDYADDRRDSRRDLGKAAAAAGVTGASLYAMTRDRGNSVDKRQHDRYYDDRYNSEDEDRQRAEERRYDSRRHQDNDRHRDRRDDDRKHRDDRRYDDRRAPYPEEQGLGFAFEKPESKRSSPPAEVPADERNHEDAPLAIMPAPANDPDEEYRRRMQQAQRELGYTPAPSDDADRERRRKEREARRHDRHDTVSGAESDEGRPALRRKASIIDEPLPAGTQAQVIDNSLSDKRETRVRIVDPPTEEEDKRPRGILKKPTVKFPEDHNNVREGVAPLKDATKKGIPPGARWTKIDRRLVNPEALEEAKERYEERQDCVIVLRVLTKEDIQKLADKTKELRERRFEAERRAARDRRDEYSDDGLEDWEREEKKPVRMLEAAPSDDRREHREREREGSYVSSRGRE